MGVHLIIREVGGKEYTEKNQNKLEYTSPHYGTF